MSTPTDYSRSLRLAGNAARTTESALRDRLESTRIHITAEPDLPAVTDSLAVLVADLRRLPVDLSIDPLGGTTRITDALIAALWNTADGIDPKRPLHLTAARNRRYTSTSGPMRPPPPPSAQSPTDTASACATTATAVPDSLHLVPDSAQCSPPPR